MPGHTIGDVLIRMKLRGQIYGLLVFLIVLQDVGGLSTIFQSRRPAVSVNLTLTCRDDGPITQQVNFRKDSSLRGGCSPGCGTGVSEYVVSQNIAAQETYLTISSLEQARDSGNWTCRQGSDAESSAFVINPSLPCFLDPAKNITVTPPVSSLTSAENISVQVAVSCCSQNAAIKWTYQKQNETPVTLASNTSTPSASCPAGQTETQNTFQPRRNAFPPSGKVNLTLSIEHDSFDPPDYTEVYTKEIDLGDTTTSSPSSTSSQSSAPSVSSTSSPTTTSSLSASTTTVTRGQSSNETALSIDYSSTTTEGTTGPTPQPGICDNNDWCYLFFLLLLLLIPFFVLVWWCRKKKRDKKSERSDDKKDERIEFKQMNRC